MLNPGKEPLSMQEGLLTLKNLTSQRLATYNSALILLFGDPGVGKSTISRIIEETELGIPLATKALVRQDDGDQESARIIYHLERGEYPEGLPQLTVINRLTSGIVSRGFGVGREVVLVELGCDRETQISNLATREYQKAQKLGTQSQRDFIWRDIDFKNPDFTSIDERSLSWVYADILINTSESQRITASQARKVLLGS